MSDSISQGAEMQNTVVGQTGLTFTGQSHNVVTTNIVFKQTAMAFPIIIKNNKLKITNIEHYWTYIGELEL